MMVESISSDCSPTSSERSMRREFESLDDERVRSTRPLFLDFACSTFPARADAAAFEIVYTELVANVIKHSPGPFSIAVYAEPAGRLILEVCDSGKAFHYSPTLPSDPYSISGRGLYVVSQLCDELKLTRTLQGNRVRAALRCVEETVFPSQTKLREIPFHLFARFRCLVRR